MNSRAVPGGEARGAAADRDATGVARRISKYLPIRTAGELGKTHGDGGSNAGLHCPYLQYPSEARKRERGTKRGRERGRMREVRCKCCSASRLYIGLKVEHHLTQTQQETGENLQTPAKARFPWEGKITHADRVSPFSCGNSSFSVKGMLFGWSS